MNVAGSFIPYVFCTLSQSGQMGKSVVKHSFTMKKNMKSPENSKLDINQLLEDDFDNDSY